MSGLRANAPGGCEHAARAQTRPALIRERLSDAPFATGSPARINRHLIEGMANEGEPFVVLNESEAQRADARFVQDLESPLLSRVKGQTGFDASHRAGASPGPVRRATARHRRQVPRNGRGRDRRHRVHVPRALRAANQGGPGSANSANEAWRHLWARERVRRLPPGGGSSWVVARRGGGWLHHRRHRAGAVRRRILAAIRPLAKTG